MSWGAKTTCLEAPGVSLGGSGVSIGGVRSLRACFCFCFFRMPAASTEWGPTISCTFLPKKTPFPQAKTPASPMKTQRTYATAVHLEGPAPRTNHLLKIKRLMMQPSSEPVEVFMKPLGTPPKINMEPKEWSFGEQMILLFNCVIFWLQPLIFRGVNNTIAFVG